MKPTTHLHLVQGLRIPTVEAPLPEVSIMIRSTDSVASTFTLSEMNAVSRITILYNELTELNYRSTFRGKRYVEELEINGKTDFLFDSYPCTYYICLFYSN